MADAFLPDALTTMTLYTGLLMLHVLGACIWAGGHLALAAAVLPRALRERRATIILNFENGFERIGLPALVVQVVTGLWLAHIRLGSPGYWFESNPVAHIVQAKLAFLAGTVALAVHARLGLIPRLRDHNLRPLAWHIIAVTVLAVSFVLAGVLIRVGGLA